MYLKNTIIMACLAILGFSSVGTSQTSDQESSVSDEDLEKFVVVYKQVQTKNQEIQQEMVVAVQDEGMEVQRYTEISQAEADPAKEVEASEEEMKTFSQINEKISSIQKEFQEEVKGMIEEEGMTLQRYQEVYTALQQDTDLQSKFNEMMTG